MGNGKGQVRRNAAATLAAPPVTLPLQVKSAAYGGALPCAGQSWKSAVMLLRTDFDRVIFTPEVVEAGYDAIRAAAEGSEWPESSQFSVDRKPDSWYLDDAYEWFAEYGRGTTGAHFSYSRGPYRFTLSYWASQESSDVSISAPTRGEVEKLMRLFANAAPACRVPEPIRPDPPVLPPITVFLGHGHSGDWRLIKDHLQDKHAYRVEAYEVGARAGHTIRDVLESMLVRSTIAFLVLTAEDESGDARRARQNVVHEVGLFQGRLGFNRAIAVVENGVEVFSNLQGVDQIRYDAGHVESTFGEILATIRRELDDARSPRLRG